MVPFMLIACGETKPTSLTQEEVNVTYIQDNRSLNLDNKHLSGFVNLNEYIGDKEINNIYLADNAIELLDISSFKDLGGLDLSQNQIRFWSDLKLPEWIRSINLANNKLDSLNGIIWLKKIKKLNLDGNNLDDDDIVLADFPNLKYISAKNNNLSPEVLEAIDIFNSKYLINNPSPF